MRILHILSQFEITGAEVYAATLSDAQKAAGNEVVIVSPYWHTKISSRYLSVKNIGQAAMTRRFLAVFQIRKIIKELNIEVVHTHSRASSWAAHFATKGLPVAYVSTIHGRQHLHKRKHLNVYGENIIAVCENLKRHLTLEVGIPEGHISVIGNGMHLPDFSSVQKATLPFSSDKIVLCIPGRTSGPKGERTGNLIERVFPLLMDKYPSLCIVVVGDEVNKFSKAHQDAWQRFSTAYPDRNLWVGFVSTLDSYLAASDIVIGSGRVAIEALLLQKPTIAFGESTFEGLVNAASLEEALASNFGDISSNRLTKPYNWLTISDEIEGGIKKRMAHNNTSYFHDSELITNKIVSTFSLEKVSESIKAHYQRALGKIKR